MVDQTTTNFGFPLMSEDTTSEDFSGIWHEILDNGGDQTTTDGLIRPLDSILADAYFEVDDPDSVLTLENVNGKQIRFTSEA